MENTRPEDKLPTSSVEVIDKVSPAADFEVPKEDDQGAKLHREPVLIPRPYIRFPSCQLVFVIMGALGFFMVYSLRVNMSVSVVAMVNMSYVKRAAVSKDEPCIVPKNTTNIKHEKFPGTFEFDGEDQSNILLAFFFGYFIFQVPGGTLAQKVGGKRVLIGSMFFTSFFTLLTPVLAERGGFWGLLLARAFTGLAESSCFPAMHVLMAKWTTPKERTTIVTFIYAGNKLGIVATNACAGQVCETIGWQYVFYITGGLGALWCFFSTFLIYATPREHPRISPAELHYIETSQGESSTKGTLRVPWLKIFTSPPVYALLVAHFVYNWSNFTLLQTLPQYLKFILDYDIKESGFFAGLPYLLMWAVMIATGLTCDYLKRHDVMSVTNIRKFMITFSFITAGSFLVGTGYVVCNQDLAVALLCFSVGLSGVSWGGWSVNQMDLAPPYAGTLMGITNGFSTVGGMIGARVVGAFTKMDQTRAAWKKFFFLTAGLDLFGCLVFCLFGTGKRQEWGYEPTAAATKKEVAEADESNKEESKADKSKEESA